MLIDEEVKGVRKELKMAIQRTTPLLTAPVVLGKGLFVCIPDIIAGNGALAQSTLGLVFRGNVRIEDIDRALTGQASRSVRDRVGG